MNENHLLAVRGTSPALFLDLLSTGTLSLALLSLGAEMAGEIEETYQERARTVLCALLEHPDSVVREGAVYGLAQLGSWEEVSAMQSDTSPGVSEAARSLLGTKDENAF